jgi:hypothetical protein
MSQQPGPLTSVLEPSGDGALTDCPWRGEKSSRTKSMFLSRRRSAGLLGVIFLLLAGAQAAWSQAGQQGGDFSSNPGAKKLPTGIILVRGAWSSASDSKTPVPEGGKVVNSVYRNDYFRIAFPLPPSWVQKYTGPPPSDSGYYVLAQFRPSDLQKGSSGGYILITAQDLFFTLTPATNALELTKYDGAHLNSVYKVEQAPTPVTIANRAFMRFDYVSPVAGLHWFILATQIRCHVIQFIFTSRDTALLESLIRDMNGMSLPAEASPILGTGGGDVPVCVKNYASGENVLYKVEPVFTARRFNPVPVRIIIDKQGKVKHIHFLSAFPDQAKAITEALHQWQFRPYLVNGKPLQVETGVMFGNAPRLPNPSGTEAVNE